RRPARSTAAAHLSHFVSATTAKVSSGRTRGTRCVSHGLQRWAWPSIPAESGGAITVRVPVGSCLPRRRVALRYGGHGRVALTGPAVRNSPTERAHRWSSDAPPRPGTIREGRFGPRRSGG